MADTFDLIQQNYAYTPYDGQAKIIELIQTADRYGYDDIPAPMSVMQREQFAATLERSGIKVDAMGNFYADGQYHYNDGFTNPTQGKVMLESEKVTDPQTGKSTIKTKQPNAGTTTKGTQYLKGVMNMEVNPVVGTLAVAKILGYEWKEINEHLEFWTDMSDALLGFDQGGLAGNLTPEALKLKNGLTVALRALDDGGIAMYCEKERLMSAINAMYEAGAFNTNEDLVPDITESGHYLIVPGGVSLEEALGVTGQRMPNADVLENSIATFNTYINTHPANAMVISWYTSTWSGGGFVDVKVDCYNIPANSYMDVTVVNGNIRTNSGLPNFVGSYQLQYDLYTGTHRQSGWGSATPQAPNNLINGVNNTTHVKSTVNTTHIIPAGALEPDPTPGTVTITDPSQIATLLADWLNDGFSTTRYNPETDQNEQVDWLPVLLPDFYNNPEGTPGGQTETQSGRLPGYEGDPSLIPQYIMDYLIPNITFPNFQVPEVPEGGTPLPFVPTNSMSSKLYTVYNPSNANLDSLGAFMWNTSIIQQLVELFTNNPMDAIISLHQIYATPSTGGNKNIILGVLDSNVPAPVVTNQYVVIDCGTVSVAEIYGDARDYTQVQTDIFLPFIGLRSLDCHDVIGCQVGVKFKIDVYTGSTLAEISVTKQGVTQILYTFEGNCSVQIPLTAADRSRMIQGIVAATTGLITGGVGAMAGAAAAASLGGAMQTSIQKSSAFSGNAGAMGGKKPYIVVTRQKSADAVSYNTIIGNPTNKTVYLKDCRGFTRVKDIHIDIPRATAIEKEMLYGVLKSGIII